MNRRTRFAVGALATAALVAAACGSPNRSEPTGPLADIRLEASDGKTHTLADLTRNGDVFLYGIKNGCPENAKAENFYDALARAYQGRAQLVGLSNLDAESFPKWRDRFEPSYPVLFDPDKQMIGALGIERSPWLVQIGRDGQVVKTWPGYSALDLENMNEAMARAAGVPAADLDFSAAPERTRYG